MTNARPNFLLITTDQQRADAIGCVNPAIRTPNLDRLAAGGVLFDRGYTVNPVCTPSRVSILTGQYPSRHGCYHVGTGLPEPYEPNVARLLAGSGYYTALLGKAHFLPCLDPASFESAPQIHDRAFFRQWQGPFYGFDRARLVIGHTCEPHGCGMHYGVWLEEQGVDTKKYFGTHGYNDMGAWDLPAEFHGSRWVADETIRALDAAAAQDRPFFLWTSFQDPHNPLFTPEPWAGLHRDADVPAYGLRPGEMDDKPWFYRTLVGQGTAADAAQPDVRGWSDVRRLGLTAEQARHGLALYYGMVSLMDHHLGRILDALESRGLLDNTIIVFTSDHGDYTGNHGLWGKGLPAYEDMQRVPFVVRHPRCATPGLRSGALQSLVDIAPTFLALAGVGAAPGMQGLDQGAAWADGNRRVRDAALFEFRPRPDAFMQLTMIEEQYKLVVYQGRDEGELYDLRADPGQYRNRWGDTPLRPERDRLLRRLLDAQLGSDGTLRPRTAFA